MDGAEIVKILGESTRLRIIFLLIPAEMCVCELEVILACSQPNISRHLQKLKSAGIVDSHRDGQWIHYRVSKNFLDSHPSLLKSLAELTAGEELFRKDQQRLNTYRTRGFTCQDLKKDREQVVAILH